jgi:hypothetical protein
VIKAGAVDAIVDTIADEIAANLALAFRFIMFCAIARNHDALVGALGGQLGG